MTDNTARLNKPLPMWMLIVLPAPVCHIVRITSSTYWQRVSDGYSRVWSAKAALRVAASLAYWQLREKHG